MNTLRSALRPEDFGASGSKLDVEQFEADQVAWEADLALRADAIREEVGHLAIQGENEVFTNGMIVDWYAQTQGPTNYM